MPSRPLLSWPPALVLLALLASPARADVTVGGHVYDLASGDGLPQASVQVVDRYHGTIANDDGDFVLIVDHLPVTLRVTYIGYSSLERTVSDSASTLVDFPLRVSPYRLPATIVRPDDARRIMAEVIRHKAEWRPRLTSWRSEAFTRFTMEKEEAIVAISESVSEVHWDAELGYREVVVSQRATENLAGVDQGDFEMTTSAMEGFVDLYDDDIEFIEHRLIGPTHPDALEHYDFDLVSRRVVDERVVFDIDVRPKHKVEAAFSGRLSVLDGDFGLLEAELQPNRSILEGALPLPLFERFEWTYRQQWRSFDGVWLPVDYRFDGRIRIGTFGLHFPEMGFHGVTRMSRYEVNVETPDTLFAEDTPPLRVDSVRVRADSTFERGRDAVPMTQAETEAYATVDSTQYLEKVFRPTGLLTTFMPSEEEMDEERQRRRQERLEARARSDTSVRKTTPHRGRWDRSLGGRARYNRVEEIFAGGDAALLYGEGARLFARAGYSTGLERFSGRLGIAAGRSRGVDSHTVGGRLEVGRGAVARYDSELYHPIVSSAQTLLGIDDYFDYYWRESVELEATLEDAWPQTRAWLTARAERHESLTTSLELDPFDRLGRVNPTIEEGDLRSLGAGWRWGDAYTPFGVIANKRLQIDIEYADDWLGSDYAFSTWRLAADWQQPTLWRRRWLPNTLDLRLLAGTSTGDVPLQRHRAIDVALGPFSPFGGLRGLHGHPYEAHRYAALLWEHNFRTTPFEYLSLWPLVRRAMSVLVHGGTARTWDTPSGLRGTDGWHHELGLSLALYGMLRIDATRRLDDPGWRFGASFARFDFD